MSVNGAEYDKIMQKYNLTRIENARRTDDRRFDVYDKIPRIREIDDLISTSAIAAAKNKIRGIKVDEESIRLQNHNLQLEKANLLLEHGYKEDYLNAIYTCNLCKDTGYIENKPCICFRHQITASLYENSGLKNLLEKENFSTFSYDYYSSENDGIHKHSPQDNIQSIVEKSHQFIDEFGSHKDNLLLRGETGLGKTFLTNCIARELMDQGHTVYYVTSNNLFEKVIADVVMNRDSDPKSRQLYKHVYDAELLIIDDLGTEFTNSFVATQLFQCVNTRLQEGKSTIISTNLTLKELRDRYSERIMSRVIENYMVFEFYGNNIRYQKRLAGLKK